MSLKLTQCAGVDRGRFVPSPPPEPPPTYIERLITYASGGEFVIDIPLGVTSISMGGFSIIYQGPNHPNNLPTGGSASCYKNNISVNPSTTKVVIKKTENHKDFTVFTRVGGVDTPHMVMYGANNASGGAAYNLSGAVGFAGGNANNSFAGGSASFYGRGLHANSGSESPSTLNSSGASGPNSVGQRTLGNVYYELAVGYGNGFIRVWPAGASASILGGTNLATRPASGVSGYQPVTAAGIHGGGAGVRQDPDNTKFGIVTKAGVIRLFLNTVSQSYSFPSNVNYA